MSAPALSELPQADPPDDPFGSRFSSACVELLESLRRSDQRKRGEQYIRALLTAEGRKTARNLATVIGEHGADQSLHHFVAGSTWDWSPIRAALSRYVERELCPRAWVIQQMMVPKAGENSVGVRRRFVSGVGRVVNCQQSHGLWLASNDASAPVSWRLRLDGATENGTAGEEQELARLVSRSARKNRERPVVMDARANAVGPLAAAFAETGIPYMFRIGANTPFAIAGDGVHPGGRMRTAPAQHLMKQAKHLGRPVNHRGCASFVAPLPVEIPGLTSRRPLLLTGVWRAHHRRPPTLWLTDLSSWTREALLRLTRLPERVDTDFSGTGIAVGIRDFEGRSFQGWHRHVTLASIAHTFCMSGTAPTPVPPEAGFRPSAGGGVTDESGQGTKSARNLDSGPQEQRITP